MTRPVPTPQAIAGAVYNLLVGPAAIGAVVYYGTLSLEQPLHWFIPACVLAFGVLYTLSGVALLLPWRLAYHIGRGLLIAGIVANLALAMAGGYVLPRDAIIDYPLLVAAPGFVLGLAMLEAIVLLWPEDPPETQGPPSA